MDWSSPMQLPLRKTPSHLQPGVQCRFELTKDGCRKRNCKFYHSNKEKQSPSKNSSSPSGPSNSSSNASKKSPSVEKNDKMSSSYKKPVCSDSIESSSKAAAEQNQSVEKKDLVLDKNKESASVESPAISLPEPSPTVVKPVKTNMLRVIDEKLLKEPEQVTSLLDTEKRKTKSISQLEQEFMEPEPGTTLQKTARKARWSKMKKKAISEQKEEERREGHNKIVRSETLTLDEEEQPLKRGKKKNKSRDEREKQKGMKRGTLILDEEEQPMKKKAKLCNKVTGSRKEEQSNPEKMFNIENPSTQKRTQEETENAQSIMLYNHLERCKYRIVKKFSEADGGFSSHPRKLNCVEEGEVVTVKSHCKLHFTLCNQQNCPYIEVKDVLNNVGFVHQDCLGESEIPNPEDRLSSEPEVILVDECDSMDDIKRENEVMKKEKEALVKQLEELKKENEEVKTKVAQYQKGAIVWNGTLARSKADLADERKKSAQKSLKISQLSTEKLAKEKKLTDELNDLKKQMANHNSDVEKERDQLDSDLMDLKEEKSKQDVIIEELKLKIKTHKSVDKNEGSNENVINQAGKLKIKQIEKTLQERKEGWLKKMELYQEKLAAKEEKTNELEELLESKEVDLTNMRNDLEAMEKERDDLDSTLVDLRTELGEKELILVQLESKQNENKEVEEKLAELQNTNDQTVKQLNEKLKEKSDMFKQQTIVIKRLNSQKAELESSKIDVSKKVVEIESIVTVKQDEIEILKNSICELNQRLEENESGSTILTLEKKNKHLQDELSKHENEIRTQDERMKKYKEMFTNLANSM